MRIQKYFGLHSVTAIHLYTSIEGNVFSTMSGHQEPNNETEEFQDALDEETTPAITEAEQGEQGEAGNSDSAPAITTTNPSKKKKNKKKKKTTDNLDSASTSQLDLSTDDRADNGQEQGELPETVSENNGENSTEQLESATSQAETGEQVFTKSKSDLESENDIKSTSYETKETSKFKEQTGDIVAETTNIIENLHERPLSESTDNQEGDLQNQLMKEKTALQDKLDALGIDDKREVESKSSVPSSPTSQIIPHRAPPPALPTRSTHPAPSTQNETAPPPLPTRDHVATEFAAGAPPPIPQRLNGPAPHTPQVSPLPEGLRPFKNKTASSQHESIASGHDFAPPPLPPQLTETQKAQHRSNVGTGIGGIGSWFSRGSLSSRSNTDLSEKSVEYEENYDLLLSRLTENNEEYLSRDGLAREQLDTSINELKSSFNEKVSEIEGSFTEANGDETTSTANDSELDKIDWPFWTKVVNNYATVAKSEPSKLSKEISKGIPKQIRSIVWQLVTNASPQQFEEQFKLLLTQETPCEKRIQMDLSRTSYIADHCISQESLCNVLRVYSLIDPEVGYTQGMAFITAPLLLDMSELEAFAVLYKLMNGYNLRSLYLPEMPGLLLTLYQFDRLVEDLLPNLHAHFLRQGVRSSMYATQWFLTFFAYKFPLEFVLRIYDIVMTEGFESILKFAVALVSKNEERLLTLKFDSLLEFLKENLFSAYLIEPELPDEEEDQQQTLKGFFKFKQPKPITVDTYDVNQFIDDATNVKLLPITLRRYNEEFEQIHQQERERQEEVDDLKLRNQQLKKEIRRIEASFTILNREHVQIANEVIKNRIKAETYEDEIKDLKNQNQALRDRINAIQKQEVEVPANFENDLKNAMERNLEVMTQNQELEDQVSSLLQEIEDLKAENAAFKAKEEDAKLVQTATTSGHTSKSGWGKKFFRA